MATLIQFIKLILNIFLHFYLCTCPTMLNRDRIWDAFACTCIPLDYFALPSHISTVGNSSISIEKIIASDVYVSMSVCVCTHAIKMQITHLFADHPGDWKSDEGVSCVCVGVVRVDLCTTNPIEQYDTMNCASHRQHTCDRGTVTPSVKTVCTANHTQNKNTPPPTKTSQPLQFPCPFDWCSFLVRCAAELWPHSSVVLTASQPLSPLPPGPVHPPDPVRP